jgi:hypothetical protein
MNIVRYLRWRAPYQAYINIPEFKENYFFGGGTIDRKT